MVFNVIDPRDLSLTFGQHQVSDSSDIAGIEFVVGVLWCAKSMSCQTQLILCHGELSCGGFGGFHL